jgi:hypothetical protein
VTEIFTSVDKDGDSFEIEHEGDEYGDLTISVRQDGRTTVAFLSYEQFDEMVAAVLKHRCGAGPHIPISYVVTESGETDYDRRLNAARDARALMGQLFGPPKANDLVLVTEYLLNGVPEVAA